MKRQATGSENIFANHVSDKGLMFIIYKEFSKLNSKKKKSNQKTDKRFEQTFHQRGYTDGKSVCEKMFNIISHYENAN